MFLIIWYFSTISVVFALNMSIYSGFNRYSEPNGTPLKKFKDKYNFSYKLNDKLEMNVDLKNAAPGVTATAYITQNPTSTETRGDIRMKNSTTCHQGLCISIGPIILNTSSIFIGLQLYQASKLCRTIMLTEGKQILSNTTNKDMCVAPQQETNLCVIEIDVQNECHVENKVTLKPNQSTIAINEGNQQETTANKEGSSSPPPPSSWSQNNISGFKMTYIILSVIGMICVLILAICLFVKKYRRNLKQKAPSNEVIYADLGFAHENSRPPDDHLPRKPEEESPYAEIIGVLQTKK